MFNLNDRQITNFAAYAQAGAMGRETKFINIQDLIKADEEVLVLVPYGTPEELNSHSLQFWHLQDAIANAAVQFDISTADLKAPQFKLMDPSFEEKIKPDGLIQQCIKQADIVLELVDLNTWCITKHSGIVLDENYRYELKFTGVTLAELFENKPKEVWVYIDHRQVPTSLCENLYHAFCNHLVERQEEVKPFLMSGHPTPQWRAEKEIILMATPAGFFVDKARGTSYVNHFISAEELSGQRLDTLKSDC